MYKTNIRKSDFGDDGFNRTVWSFLLLLLRMSSAMLRLFTLEAPTALLHPQHSFTTSWFVHSSANSSPHVVTTCHRSVGHHVPQFPSITSQMSFTNLGFPLVSLQLFLGTVVAPYTGIVTEPRRHPVVERAVSGGNALPRAWSECLL